jgi:hypothetical protein
MPQAERVTRAQQLGLPVQDHADRIGELAELRDFVKAAPVSFRRELKAGPREEPACGLCSAINAAGGCASYADQLHDYHDVGVLTMAQLAGIEFEDLAAALDIIETSGADRLIRALAGALSAERCLTLYLLAGWTPPRVRRAFMGGDGGR